MPNLVQNLPAPEGDIVEPAGHHGKDVAHESQSQVACSTHESVT